MAGSGEKVKPGKRRVPDSLRRRTLVSCDRCKIRRIRCYRANQHESCASCLNGGVKCESTLPRKQRVYGSVERFSLRYRALDALVRGLFPNEDTDDIDALFRLARDRGISMPSADDQTPAPEAFSRSSPTISRSPAPTQTDPLNAADDLDDTSSSEVFEERLIPAPHGVSHYVGPVSSFDFASTIRQLVAKYNGIRARDGQRTKLEVDFANAMVSKALEPRIKGHPATVACEGRHGSDNQLPSRQRNHEQLYSTLDPPPSVISNKSPNQNLRDMLPPRDLSDVLVRAFFDRVHPNYTLFHRDVFQLRYESLWHPNTSQAHDPEPGWVCSLFMMFVLGAETLGEDGSDEAISIQTRYVKMVRERFEQLAFTASLANVQALLLLQLYEHNAGERNTAWMFLGLAARMAIALGMHREGANKGFDSIERNTRRIVWWTLYMFEQNVSIILGRPPSIDPMEVNVRLPDEAIFDGGDFPPDYHAHALSLIQIAPRVKRLASAVSPKYLNEEALLPICAKAAHMLQELDSWKSRLPQHLTPNWHFMSPRHRRAVLMMHVYYYHLKSIVARPYLLCRVNRNIDRQLQTANAMLAAVSANIDSLGQDCCSSAKAALDHLHQLSIFGLLEGVAWMDFYYVYHGMMVMSLDFLGRPRDSPPDSARDVAHKMRLSSMIDLSRRSKLAPTYKILSRVAIDLSLIAGVGNEEASSQEERKQSEIIESVKPPIQSVPPQQAFSAVSSMPAVHQNDISMPVPELISDLYQFGTNEMPWDFFNISVAGNGDFLSGSSQQMSAQFSGGFDEMGLMNHAQPNNWPG
ncbi:hypothetical protein VTN77DRAFT_1938 [Rasamsonia byssochlamydoides]|uniref:uncharacterized protein n=1 Tax=Rasamsonia byssochlamydoides TaxID=89139 RepID=UPI0037431D6D